MPLYEYECEACGHRFEVIQKFSDAPIDKCPKCGSTVHKLQSAPAFHLKGTGWYATDYAKSGSTPDSKGGKETKKTDEGSSASASSESGSSSASEKSSSGESSTPAASSPAAKPDTSKS